MSLTPEQQRDISRQFTAMMAKTAGVLFYATVLYYIHKLQIAPSFSYSGLTYREPELFSYSLMLVVTCAVAIVLPSRITRPSDFILWMLFVIAGAPSILLAQYMDTLSVPDATEMGLAVAGCFVFIRLLTARGPRRFTPRLTMNARAVWQLLGVFTVLVYLYLLASGGLQLQLLALTDVYDVREEFGAATSGSLLAGYVLPIQYSVINPAFMARGVYSRRRLPFLAGALGQVLIYSSTGQKTVLLSIAGVVAVALLFRTNLRPPGSRLMLAVGLGALGMLVMDWLTDSLIWSSLFVRRFLVVPGALTAAYVAVFADRAKTNFSDSLLIWLDSPYTLIPPGHLVGGLFVGDVGTNANVNLFGHGFLNYGYLGMFIEALVLVVLLWVADDAARGLPTPVAALVFFMPAFALASSSVFTTALTHGLLAAIIVCSVLPRTGWGRKRPKIKEAASGSPSRPPPAIRPPRHHPVPGVAAHQRTRGASRT